MDNIESNYNEDEEISLIDLFAVLIRFRKLIVFGTGLVTILAGLYLFVLPKFMPSLNNRNVTATYTVNVKTFPRTISLGLSGLGLSLDLNGYLTYAFTNCPSVAKEYKKFPFIDEKYPEDNFEYNLFIKNLIKNKKIQISKSLGATYSVDFELPYDGLETLNHFIKDYVLRLNLDITEKAVEAIDQLEAKTRESLRELSASSNTTSSSLQLGDVATEQSLREILQDINALKKNPAVFYSVIDEPFVLSVAQGRVKKLVIICFAAFFVFVFIAFAKNAVMNIKEDPEASKTLRQAWESGK